MREEGGRRRSIYRHVSSGGSFGGNPFRQFFGVGRAVSIDKLEIRWPTSKGAQIFTDVPLDRHVMAVESEDRLSTRDLEEYEFHKG